MSKRRLEACPERLACQPAEMAPHGAYPCRDGEWISIAVTSDARWVVLAGLIGGAELADDPRFATLALRHANERELDRIVSGWTAGRDAATLAGLLQENAYVFGEILGLSASE